MIHREFERLKSSADLKTHEVQQQIIARVTEEMRPAEGELAGVVEPVDVSSIVAATTHADVEKTIDIPRITAGGIVRAGPER